LTPSLARHPVMLPKYMVSQFQIHLQGTCHLLTECIWSSCYCILLQRSASQH
jgi:hypothetical protein